MSLRVFSKRVLVDATPEVVFDWHTMPGALERLTPPWQPFQMVDRGEGLVEDSRVVVRTKHLMVPFTMEILHRSVRPPEGFDDIQTSGPFRRLEHRHRFDSADDGKTKLSDEIEFEIPGFGLGDFFLAQRINREFGDLFEYRHRICADDIVAFGDCRHSGAAHLNILVTGASGVVGSALVPLLTSQGHQVLRAVRRQPVKGGLGKEVRWRPEAAPEDVSNLEKSAFEGLDAVIHLAAENIAVGRWTPESKQRFFDSRVGVTERLCQLLASLDAPPRTFLCASATGIYDADSDEDLDENGPQDDGYLGEMCRKWEEACEVLVEGETRVVSLRIGVILTPAGGALKKLLPAYRFGLGGRLGSGKQGFSWISIEDAIQAILWLLNRDELSGAINLTAPAPVSNQEFSDTLGKVLHRPTLLPVPGKALRMVFGEMAEDLLLKGSRIIPGRLIENDFPFRNPTLEEALQHLLPAHQ